MPEDVNPSIHLARLRGRLDRTAARMLDYAERNNITDLRQLRDTPLPWFEVRSAAAASGAPRDQSEATVFIYDEIGGSFGVQASELSQQIEALDVARINVRINSPGGSVFDALAIHSSLLHHPAHVVTYVDGIAASAASVIAMAGDEVVMMPGSEMMIHDASNMIDGNKKEHEGAALFLDRQSDNIAGIYADRAGGTVEEWRALMLAETWLFAREAVSVRLATSLYPYGAHPAVTGEPELEARMSRAHDLGRWAYRHHGRRNAPEPAITRRGAEPRVRTNPREESPTTAGRKLAADRTAAANMRAQRMGEMRQHAGRQLRLQEHAPSGVNRPGVEFTTEHMTAKMERRDGKEFVFFDGYATMYDRPYEMWDMYGPYNEVVVSGAADETLGANPDTAYLVNHRGLTMARTTNGSLLLATDSMGMPVQAWMNPVRPDVQLLKTAVEDGDITEMSFAFIITRGEWSADFLTFYIEAFDINRGDVSAVNYGANPYTSVSARTREIMQELEHLPGPAAREAVRRLSMRLGEQVPAAPVGVAVPESVTWQPVANDDVRQTETTGRSLSDVQAMLARLREE